MSDAAQTQWTDYSNISLTASSVRDLQCLEPHHNKLCFVYVFQPKTVTGAWYPPATLLASTRGRHVGCQFIGPVPLASADPSWRQGGVRRWPHQWPSPQSNIKHSIASPSSPLSTPPPVTTSLGLVLNQWDATPMNKWKYLERGRENNICHNWRQR
jgi:hypothetical protein